MAQLKVNVSFPASMLEDRGLLKLGRLYGYYLALSSRWRILAAKLAVSSSMDLLVDMTTDAKREIKKNTFGMPFTFLHFS